METKKYEKFINEGAARLAFLTFILDACTFNEHVTTSYSKTVGKYEVTIYTKGRNIPKLSNQHVYSYREINLHKREDWTNFTCFVYYFEY